MSWWVAVSWAFIAAVFAGYGMFLAWNHRQGRSNDE